MIKRILSKCKGFSYVILDSKICDDVCIFFKVCIITNFYIYDDVRLVALKNNWKKELEETIKEFLKWN